MGKSGQTLMTKLRYESRATEAITSLARPTTHHRGERFITA